MTTVTPFLLPPGAYPNDRRPTDYKVIHQQLNWSVQLEEQRIQCYTDLIILPITDQKLKYIYVNCKHAIQSVTLDGLTCQYDFHTLPSTRYSRTNQRPSTSTPTLDQVRAISVFEQEVMEEADVAEQGELRIHVPESKQRMEKVTLDGNSMEQKSDSTNEVAEPLILRICYTLLGRDLSGGLHFLRPTPYAPHRSHQLITTSSIASGIEPSLWMPCIDQFDERYTWELEITVASEYTVVASGTLGSKRPISGGKTVWSFKSETPVQARAIGIVIGPFIGDAPVSDDQLQWLSVPSRPAGLTKVADTKISPSSSSSSSTTSTATSTATTNAPTLQLLRHSFSQHLPAIMTLYETLFGSPYPFGTFKVVCMEEVHSKHIGFTNFIVLDKDLLYDATLIDQVYITTIHLAYAIAVHWVGSILSLDSPADWWIVQGISSWACSCYIAQVFGVNEMKYRSLQTALYVLDEDAEQKSCYHQQSAAEDDAHVEEPIHRLYESHPLYWPGYLTWTDLENPIQRAKAQIVFKMLDQRIGGGSTASATSQGQGGLKNLVLRIMDEFSTSLGGDENEEGGGPPRLSTIKLLELCIELAAQVSGIASLKSSTAAPASATASQSALDDLIQSSEHGEILRQFWEQWILCTGYPAIQVDFLYEQKRKVSTIQIEQSPSVLGITPLPHRPSPYLKFHGPLKLRIYESDRINDQERIIPLNSTSGTATSAPFTVLPKSNRVEYEFICSSKVRRNRKRKKMDEQTLSQLPLEKLLVRHNDTPILYCRIDPFASWFTPFLKSEQEPIHLLEKLLREKELIGQFEGIKHIINCWKHHLTAQMTGVTEQSAIMAAREATSGLSDEKLPDDIYPKTLWQIFKNEQLYVQIRLEAAKALCESVSQSFVSGSTHFGVNHMKYVYLLIDWFKKEYYENYQSNLHQLNQGGSGDTLMEDASSSSSTIQLRTNFFTNIQDYILKSSLPLILSKVRLTNVTTDLSGDAITTIATPGEITKFLIGLLKENDNSENPYSDVFYLGTLLDCLGNIKLSPYDTIDSIQQELTRYLNYDQVVPSYRYHLTQHALMASAKLERTKQILRPSTSTTPNALTHPSDTIVPYEQFTGQSYDRSVRLAAFKSMVMVLPTKPHLLRKCIDVIEKEVMPGAASKMLLHWGWQIVHGNCPAKLFREVNEENASFMNRLWRLMNLTHDLRVRDAAYRLYRVIWGRGNPRCSSSHQIQLSKQLFDFFTDRQRKSGELTWTRRARAEQYLQTLREPREFPPESFIPPQQPKSKRKNNRGEVMQVIGTTANIEEDEQLIDY